MRGLAPAAVVAVLLSAGAPTAAGAYTKEPVRVAVRVGPAASEQCTIDADLYRPAQASASAPAPAILASHGLGGSKRTFDEIAPALARRGYVVLAYSNLGMGDSSCKISLGDPAYDGRAGSELISFLAAHDFVRRDGPQDPRVGMLGASYGGTVQFAVASVDARLDTIVPQMAWNDLAYTLAPNNTAFSTGVTSAVPGVVKYDWPLVLFGTGAAQGVFHAPGDPDRLLGCPSFRDDVCRSLAAGGARGHLDPATVASFRRVSVASYIDRIRIPTFITQGQSDTLLNVQEAVATYRALKARGVPVKMLWRSFGHSGGGLGRAEADHRNPEAAYETRMNLAWYDHYLQDRAPRPALDFSFYTDWLTSRGDAAPAVGQAPSYPVAHDTEMFLSGNDALVGGAGLVRAGTALIASPGSAPASTGGGERETSAFDTPGTAVAYTTPPLSEHLDVAGIPHVTVELDAPAFARGDAGDPASALVLFAKLYDVDERGVPALVRDLVSPVRVPDPTGSVAIELPGIVHRFAQGHRLRLVVATTSLGFRGSASGGTVRIRTTPARPGILTLPRLGPPTGPSGSGPEGTTPFGPRVGAAALPPARACRGAFELTLLRADDLEAATVLVGRRTVRTLSGSALHSPVVLRHLPRGGFRLVVRAVATDGTPRRSARRYARCPAARR